MKRLAFLFLIAIILFTTQALASEDEVTTEDLMREIKSLKARVAELEEKLARQDIKLGKREKIEKDRREAFIRYEPGEGLSLEPAGLNIGIGATFVTQAAINPNSDPADDDEVCDATYSIDIEVEKAVGENGLAFLHLEAGDGGGLDGDEITTFSAVNRDAADSNNEVDVTEVWYEHSFFDGMFICTAGKIDFTPYLDNNEIANDETSQFLSTAFRNSTALETPDDNAYGIRFGIKPAEWSEINLGLMDDNANWESVFDDPFLFAQLNLKPIFLGEDRPGNYRAYCWYDNSGHSVWSNTADTDPNYGFGLSADQRILDYLTLFGRAGWEDPDVSTVEWAWSTGLQLDGIPWGRDEDYIGVAIGMDIPGNEYENSSTDRHGDPEGHFETYYNAKVNDNLHISPHYQLIWNPNGQDDDRAINILSLRGQVDF